MAVDITFRDDLRPDAGLIIELYRAAPLYRPVDDAARIARMYAGSPMVLTAWEGTRLVGILRGWTDGAYDGYVCDLAVHPDFQGRGVASELLRLATATNSDVQWVLRASKAAQDYYEHLGWQRIANGWYWPRSPWQAADN
ncbi:MAG TPA: GNAT family N-acetyltransferase [Gemmatales bacterium]|nr:GNAT family N-acetyltransferase [Gemmatales bacterium]HMP58844.1 GNAT family N-acetyltransferase [Gemmatales bacterium]